MKNPILVFIDAGVDNYQQLFDGVVGEAQPFILNTATDGVQQIDQILQKYPGKKTLHIISHGAPGCLYLGNTQLSLGTLKQYAPQLGQWDIDNLLLYGCHVAAGDAGEEFVSKLQGLTGANIAASKSLTGATVKGGNWELEVNTGKVNAATALQTEVMGTYSGVFNLRLEFAQSIGGSSYDYGWGIATDSNGNAWATGSFQGSIDIDGDGNNDLNSNGNNYDSYVAKFDIDGNLQFAQSFGGSNYDYGRGIATDNNGNVWATGLFSGSIDIDGDGNNDLTSNGGDDSYVAKFDIDGNLLFAQNIGGSSYGDYGHGIATDSNGNVWATGDFQGSIDIDGDGNNDLTSNGGSDSYVAKFDSNGNLLFSQNIGGSSRDSGLAITTDSNGNAWATGSFQGSIDIDGDGSNDLIDNGGFNNYVAKFDTNGNLLFVETIGSLSNYSRHHHGIATDSNGNVWATGGFSGSIDIDGDGNNDLTGSGSYLVKFDSNGNLLFAQNIGGSGYGITTDSNGNVWATGYFSGSIDIDGDGNNDLNGTGDHVIKFDSNGNLQFAQHIGSSNGGSGNDIATDNNGNVWSTGNFWGNIDIDGDGSNDLTHNGAWDSYIVKFSENSSPTEITLTNDTVDENVAANTVVGTFNTTDPDSGDTFTYELVAGVGDTDNTAFTIDDDELKINSSPDYETKSSYNIRVQTTDAAGETYQEELIVNINDVSESLNFQVEVSQSIGGISTDPTYDIATDNNGNVWVTGYFWQSIDVDGDGINDLTSNGSEDSYVAKFDSDGNLLFAQNIGGSGLDQGWGIATDSNGNAWVTGEFNGSIDIDGDGNNDLTSNGRTDSYIAKFDSNGNFQFAQNIGGSNTDRGYGIATDSNDNVWVTGLFTQNIDIDGDGNNDLIRNGWDSYIAKFDSNGNFLLAENIGSYNIDQGYAITTDSNDNVWLTGEFRNTIDIDGDGNDDLTSNGDRDSYVAKFDSNANFQFAQNIGGSSSDEGWGIATDSNGNAWATGYFNGSIDIDSDGNDDLISNGSNDSYVAKFDSNGNLLFAQNIGSSGSDRGYGIATDKNGNVWATGYFNGSIDIDSDGNDDLISNGSNDSYVVNFDSNGNLLFAQNIGGSSSERGRGIATNSNGDVWATGYFQQSIDTDSDGENDLTSNGYIDSYVVKFSEQTLATLSGSGIDSTLVGADDFII